MKRRLLALLMSIAMCLTLLPSEASAAPEADLWDGTTASGFEGGSGTEQDPYQIASGAQLAYLAALVNSGAPGEKCKDEYFVLTSDLNLNNLEWIPIGKDAVKMLLGESDYSVFAGNFD